MKHKNWEQSMTKWNKIVSYIEDPKKRRCLRFNWIVHICGYCIEAGKSEVLGFKCWRCKLKQEEICGGHGGELFWKFFYCIWERVLCRPIRLTNPDWEKALKYSKEIRDFIKNDEPEVTK